MTPLHIAAALALLSALLFALSQFAYTAGTFSTLAAAAVGTYHFFMKTDDKLEDSTA